MSSETPSSSTPIEDNDALFYSRADAHIFLSNDQLEAMHKEGVAASMMYASARFTAWLMAGSFANADVMKESKDNALEFFTQRFRDMLNHNIDDYIKNFDHYLKTPSSQNDPQ